jgi:TonB family protein
VNLTAEVAFTIQKDGSVTEIEFLKRSGSFAFDLAAQGAIEAAAASKAFGPLPDGFNGVSLPIAFAFEPRNR